MRIAPLFVLVFLVITLSGCVGHVKSSVVSFHKMPDDVNTEKFSVVPSEDQGDSIEFSTYSTLLSDKLTEYGWVETTVEDADFLVTLRYSIGDGRDSSRTVPNYNSGITTVYNSTSYSRTVIVEVISTDVSDSGVQEKIYEGRVTSRGSSSEIAVVMPTFIEALFKNFPGKSGKTKKVLMFRVKD